MIKLLGRTICRAFSTFPKIPIQKAPPFPTHTLTRPVSLDPITPGNLTPILGSNKKKKRVGRGRASGHGKTSTRGHKGQGQRANKKRNGFEGGQTPIKRRYRKFGFAKKKEQIEELNLGSLANYIERGWLQPGTGEGPEGWITIKQLVESGLIARCRAGVKLLAGGKGRFEKLNKPVFIELSDATKEAIELVQKLGGKVKIRYRTILKMQEHLHPEKYPLPLRDPLPALKSVLNLEKLRKLGCEVEYTKPRWVDREMKKEEGLFKQKERPDWKEAGHQSQKRTKPILPKQYTFNA